MKQFPITPHFWTKYKNTIQYWIGTDSQEQFEQNLKDQTRRAQLEKYGFDSAESVVYQFNSHGFRTAEFTDELCFISLGCSITAGVGLPIEQTWPARVAESVKLPCRNLAVGAASMNTCMRLLYHYVDYLNPQFVLLLRPNPQRLELFDHQQIVNLLPARLDIPAIQKIWYSNDINAEMNFIKNTLAIEKICQDRNIKLIIKDVGTDIETEKSQLDRFPAARDLSHPGATAQQKCAEKFLQSLNQN